MCRLKCVNHHVRTVFQSTVQVMTLMVPDITGTGLLYTDVSPCDYSHVCFTMYNQEEDAAQQCIEESWYSGGLKIKNC